MNAVPTVTTPLERAALVSALKHPEGLGAPPWLTIHAEASKLGVLGAGWQEARLHDGLPLAGGEVVLWVPQPEAVRILRAFGGAPRGLLHLEPAGGEWRLVGPGGREVRFGADAAPAPEGPAEILVDPERLEALIWLWEEGVHPQEALERLRRMGAAVSPEQIAVTYASLQEEELEGQLRGGRLRRILRRIRERAGVQTARRFVEELRRTRAARAALAG